MMAPMAGQEGLQPALAKANLRALIQAARGGGFSP